MKELYSQFETSESLSKFKIIDKVMKKILHFNEEQILLVYKITKFVSISNDKEDLKVNKKDLSKENFDKGKEEIDNEYDYSSGGGNEKGKGRGKGDALRYANADEYKFCSGEFSGNKNEEFLKLKDSDSFNKEKSKGFKGKKFI
jgi:hypothetical protein